MRLKMLTTQALAAASMLVVGSAGAQSILQFSDHWDDPNEFSLSSTADTETVTFDERRPVRVCLGEVDDALIPSTSSVEPANDTPLRVDREVGATIILEAGTCVDFAAQSIELSPVGMVPSNWALHGTIHSRAPMS